MSAADRGSRHRGERAERPDIARATDPLDVLAEQHFRERDMLAILERLADATEPDPGDAAAVYDFIGGEVADHHRDEEDGLFPLLRRRAQPEDAIETLLDRLTQEHAAGARTAAMLLPLLARLAAGGPPLDRAGREALRAYARAERRHMTLENAVLLPIARARLRSQDRRSLLLAMAARRGLVPGTPQPREETTDG